MNNLQLLSAIVRHRRLSPRTNAFNYNVFYIACPIQDIALHTPFLFSFNHFNVLSLYTKDNGARSSDSWRDWIATECRSRGIPLAPDDRVVLICHPRLFGFVFNPISYWLIYEKDTFLKGVLCEVHNTFGDTHNYFLAHDDGREILPTDVFHATKGMYVSPFNTTEKGAYAFSFEATVERFKSSIKYFQDDVHILDVSMAGTLAPLSTLSLLYAVIRYPFMTLMIVFRIHVQAVRLYFKGVKNTLANRPGPTSGNTTHGGTKSN